MMPGKSQLESYKIYCGNLAPTTTNDDLYKKFSQYGGVIEAVVMSGKCYGFVHMTSQEEGQKALLNLQGCLLNGKEMKVQQAINSRKASIHALTKRDHVGSGMGNLDDFKENAERGRNTPESVNSVLSRSRSSPASSVSPVDYSGNLPISSHPVSEGSSGRPSPLVFSSSLHTSDHLYASSSSQLENFKPPSVKFSVADGSLGQEINGSSSNCGVCGEEFDNGKHISKVLHCKHIVCADCLLSLMKGTDIKCPYSCLYTTHLAKPSISELLTIPITSGQQMAEPSQLPSNYNVVKGGQISSLHIPPKSDCEAQDCTLMPENETYILIKNELRSWLDSLLGRLRVTMTMRAEMKERMQSTIHSLSKFTKELQKKVEDEELEEALLQTLLDELNKTRDIISQDITEQKLIHVYEEVQSFVQAIDTRYRYCNIFTAVNQATEAVVLKLRDSALKSCLSSFGFQREEPFSMDSTLEQQAQLGNCANVLLMYMLSDLLTERLQQKAACAFQDVPQSSFASALGSDGPISSSLMIGAKSDLNEFGNIGKLFGTTEVASCPTQINGALTVEQGRELGSATSVISSALSLGLSNLSLLGNDKRHAVGKTFGELEQCVNKDEKRDADADSDLTKPVSYLDAAKKPAKPALPEAQPVVAVKTVPLSVRPNKSPHCWMKISVNDITIGRVVFQLHPDKAPKMCENFFGLCTGKVGYGYKGCHFFKNGEGFLAGGDIENDDGSGGYSVFEGKTFEADLCPLKDDVGMVRFKGTGTSDSGRGMVGSQFMIWYSDRDFKKFSYSLVFGRVVDGLDIVKQAASVNLNKVSVKIAECGAIQ